MKLTKTKKQIETKFDQLIAARREELDFETVKALEELKEIVVLSLDILEE